MAAMVLLYSSTPLPTECCCSRCPFPWLLAAATVLLLLPLSVAPADVALSAAAAAAATCLELLRQLLVNNDNSINMFSASFLPVFFGFFTFLLKFLITFYVAGSTLLFLLFFGCGWLWFVLVDGVCLKQFQIAVLNFGMAAKNN